MGKVVVVAAGTAAHGYSRWQRWRRARGRRRRRGRGSLLLLLVLVLTALVIRVGDGEPVEAANPGRLVARGRVSRRGRRSRHASLPASLERGEDKGRRTAWQGRGRGCGWVGVGTRS